jgi:pheromone shutdown protein TraB
VCRFSVATATFLYSSLLGATFPNRLQDIGNRFGARLGAEVAFAVDADTHGVGFHVALSDREHRVHFHLFSASPNT